jgi:hypothetical protein
VGTLARADRLLLDSVRPVDDDVAAVLAHLQR